MDKQLNNQSNTYIYIYLISPPQGMKVLGLGFACCSRLKTNAVVLRVLGSRLEEGPGIRP